MLKRKNGILAAAIMAAVPVASKGVVITYSFDLPDILVSPNKTPANFTSPTSAANILAGVTLTGTSAHPVVTVPSGYYVEYGLDATVTNNGSLGISQFTAGVTDSNSGVASVFATAASNASGTVLAGVTIPSEFSFLPYGGQADGAGGVNVTVGTAGGHTTTTGDAAYNYGSGSAANLFSTLRIGTTGANGTTANFTITGLKAGTQYLTQKSGTAGSSSATYNSVPMGAGDSYGPMPVLTINVGTGVAATNKIISLTSTAPTSYGSQLGTSITITGGNGGYTVGNTTLVAAPGQTTAFTKVSLFNPGSDQEVYALKLDKNGVAIDPSNTTLIAAIIADITGSNTGNVVASTVSGVYATLFPGYDILLTAPVGVGGTAYLGVDFSADAVDTGVTVTEIAAVPEPATAAGIVLGAAGLLLGRRKNRVTVA